MKLLTSVTTHACVGVAGVAPAIDATCRASHRLPVTPRHCRQFTASLAGYVAPDTPHISTLGNQGRPYFAATF